MHLLSQREYSQSELRQKLKSRGYDGAIAQLVVGELANSGLQSDERFIEGFIRSRVAKGHGILRIRQELRFRGVNQNGSEDFLQAYDWTELIGRVHAKKFGDSLPDSPRDYAARVRFLTQRGFGRDEIKALFQRLRQTGYD